jgi:hypothetical protein
MIINNKNKKQQSSNILHLTIIINNIHNNKTYKTKK